MGGESLSFVPLNLEPNAGRKEKRVRRGSQKGARKAVTKSVLCGEKEKF